MGGVLKNKIMEYVLKTTIEDELKTIVGVLKTIEYRNVGCIKT